MTTLIILPAKPRTMIDARAVSCVRVDEEGGILVVHTADGYAVPLWPIDETQSLVELHENVTDEIRAAQIADEQRQVQRFDDIRYGTRASVGD